MNLHKDLRKNRNNKWKLSQYPKNKGKRNGYKKNKKRLKR